MARIVRFKEKYVDDPSMCYGIEMENRICCACCGGEFEMDEVEDIEYLSDWEVYMKDFLEESFML